MATIYVPGPPASAFNKNRPISDLLQGQIRHFEHIEAQLPEALRTKVPRRERMTENGAAMYIAQVTRALRGEQVAQPRPGPVLVPATPRRRKVTMVPAIAAGATVAANRGSGKAGAGAKTGGSAKKKAGGGKRSGKKP